MDKTFIIPNLEPGLVQCITNRLVHITAIYPGPDKPECGLLCFHYCAVHFSNPGVRLTLDHGPAHVAVIPAHHMAGEHVQHDRLVGL